MAEHEGLSFAPVFIKDLNVSPIFFTDSDVWHGEFPFWLLSSPGKREAGKRDENSGIAFFLNRRIHGSSFLFFSPAALIQVVAGPEVAKNQRGNVLRLIQIRLNNVGFAFCVYET